MREKLGGYDTLIWEGGRVLLGYLTLSLSFGVPPFLANVFLQVVSSIFDLGECTQYKCHILEKRVDLIHEMYFIVFSIHSIIILCLHHQWLWEGTCSHVTDIHSLDIMVVMFDHGMAWERKYMFGLSTIDNETPLYL